MPPNSTKTLKEIATIRKVQRIGAEARAAQASLELQEKDSALSEKEQLRQATKEGWSAAVTSGQYQAETVPSWSAALIQDEDAVRHGGEERDAAATRLSQLRVEWNVATTRYEEAEELTRAAIRGVLRCRDEKMLQEASDTHSLRWYRR